jgi:hypothetical protein
MKKTTMMFRSIANPRRTTLASLDGGLVTRPAVEDDAAEAERRELPRSTANPRRTTLVDEPAS